jgi:hypothetical protein
MRSGRTIFDGVIFAAVVWEMYHPMNLNVQVLKLLTNGALSHPLAEVLWKRESVKTHKLPFVKGPLGAGCGSETVSC